MYPSKEGDGIVNRNEIVSSIRFEAIRDGLDDFDLLTIREKQIEDQINKLGLTDVKASDIMKTYCVNFTNFYNKNAGESTSPYKIYKETRRMLIKDIIENNDYLVQISEYDDYNDRLVRVYAPEGSEVKINGETVGKNGAAFESVVDCYRSLHLYWQD